MKEKYPWIKKLGLTIVADDKNSIPGIKGEDLESKLTPAQLKKFDELFGCQTCGANGAYVYDVEAVLERMFTGKITRTQKFWD